jgi:hypothetical protein
MAQNQNVVQFIELAILELDGDRIEIVRDSFSHYSFTFMGLPVEVWSNFDTQYMASWEGAKIDGVCLSVDYGEQLNRFYRAVARSQQRKEGEQRVLATAIMNERVKSVLARSR